MNLVEIVKNIVKEAEVLKDKYTNQPNVSVNYACIFCQSTEEEEKFLEETRKIGEVIKEYENGKLFKIDIDTVAGKLKLLKIRKTDPTRPERGDADFTIKDYPEFKEKYLKEDGFRVIQKENFEMIELHKQGEDVRVYFSFPPLDQQLGV